MYISVYLIKIGTEISDDNNFSRRFMDTLSLILTDDVVIAGDGPDIFAHGRQVRNGLSLGPGKTHSIIAPPTYLPE
jgi:hypothetical protein